MKARRRGGRLLRLAVADRQSLPVLGAAYALLGHAALSVRGRPGAWVVEGLPAGGKDWRPQFRRHLESQRLRWELARRERRALRRLLSRGAEAAAAAAPGEALGAARRAQIQALVEEPGSERSDPLGIKRSWRPGIR